MGLEVCAIKVFAASIGLVGRQNVRILKNAIEGVFWEDLISRLLVFHRFSCCKEFMKFFKRLWKAELPSGSDDELVVLC